MVFGLIGVFSAVFLAAAGVECIYFVHMLQLNSYRWERYLKWAGERPAAVFGVKRIFVLLALAALLVSHPTAAACAASAVIALHALLNRPKKAKKPLVYTSRVKRLLVTYGVLSALAVVGGYFTGIMGAVVIYPVCLFLTPLIVLLANFVNLPVEKGVNRYYFNDARRILQSMPDLIVIGITGSYGKTSTKQYLHKLLSVKYHVLMTPESYNTTLGVVRTVREQLKATHEIFIVEMGARQPGDIREICDLVKPKFGIITSIAPQHLETFKTIENIVRTKFELCRALPPDGVCFLNMDNAHILEQSAKVEQKFIGYGLNGGGRLPDASDYHARDISVSSAGSDFTIVAPDGGSCQYSTKILGRHNIQNLLGAAAAANTLGVSLDELVYPMKTMVPARHRLEMIRSAGPITYIDDAYNSNPDGAKAALDVLSMCRGLKFLLTPGMVELGDQQDALNYEFGRQAAAVCDFIIIVGRNDSIRRGLEDSGFPSQRLYVAENLDDALSRLKQIETPCFVLLENDLPDNYL